MKKFLILVMMLGFASPAFSQFVSFQSVHADPVQFTPPPTYNSSYMMTPPPQYRPQQPSYQTISAYTIRNGEFHKIRIKIFQKGRNIYVNSYYDRNVNMWYNAFNTIATQTTRYDPDVIYNNFDFKVNVAGLGNVYF
jgi:hypothetical protein